MQGQTVLLIMADISRSLSIVSLNMHGFNSSWLHLKELCNSYDIIFVQEHWLMESQLHYLDEIHKDFCVYSKSAMNSKCEQGIVSGRPFGGIAVLWRASLRKYISFCSSDTDGRVISLKAPYRGSTMLLFGCYFPYNDQSSMYVNSVNNVIGYMESLIDLYPGSYVCITGDFNFECLDMNVGYKVFRDFLDEYGLICCDYLESSAVGYTYHHDSLGQFSWLDHLFIDKRLKDNIINHSILVDPSNMSDHYAVMSQIPFDMPCNLDSFAPSKPAVIKEFRWDKGDVNLYYIRTGQLLSKIKHDFSCESMNSCCRDESHHRDIEIYYNELVHCLITAAEECIPKIPQSALKHYWSAALDDLKQSSIDAHNLWVTAGCPRSGQTFYLMKSSNCRYKLAIKDAVHAFENKFSDELYDSLMSKDLNTFWKTWKRKCCNKNISIPNIDGKSTDTEIAEVFKSKFGLVTGSANTAIVHHTDNVALGDSRDSDVMNWLFTVEDVDTAVFSKMKRGKAPGCDGLSPDNMIFSHPSIIVHFKRLFNLMMIHGYVPDNFGVGIVVPLIKDKHGDICNSENYRAITISPVISKIFEICLYDKFYSFLSSDELQFGFKQGLGCSPALFTLQQVVKYFSSRGSTVYMSAIDASKAFDRIDHQLLIDKLTKRNLPVCCINIIVNWYGKLYSMVRWNHTLSSGFRVTCGVRQGGILSPILFNVYVDNLITNLRNCGAGCHINSIFCGCIMYADDLLIMSPSLVGLQHMLDTCTEYGHDFSLVFNAAKTVCAAVGKNLLTSCDTHVFITGKAIPWVSSFKYLGVVFNVCDVLNVDCHSIKRKFYASFNSILSRCKMAPEPVQLHLIKSYCLPYLSYCIGALELSDKTIHQLSVCWNDAFRKVFSFKRCESVKELQYFCGELPFHYMYDLATWNFYTNLISKNNTVVNVLYKVMVNSKGILFFCEKYGTNSMSKHRRLDVVFEQFAQDFICS